MTKGENVPVAHADAAGGTNTLERATERRRNTVARLRFDPDARHLRALLEEIDACLEQRDPDERRRVRLLVSEIVARLLDSTHGAAVHLDLELKDQSVRIDISDRDGGDDFFEALDDTIFSDLTSGWGRDRRGTGGAWFEVGPIAS
jgi:hypothetical protein